MVSSLLGDLTMHLEERGFKTEVHQYSVNALAAGSALCIQFTTDGSYQDFLPRSVEAEVLGTPVRMARLENVTRANCGRTGMLNAS